jgi:hypothetical protein
LNCFAKASLGITPQAFFLIHSGTQAFQRATKDSLGDPFPSFSSKNTTKRLSYILTQNGHNRLIFDQIQPVAQW